MAIKSLKQRKRQQVLLIFGLAVLIIAVVILYFTFWQGGITVSEQLPLETDLAIPVYKQRANLILEEKLKKIELDFTFLTEQMLPFLKIHGDLPVKKGTTGRPNPFISY